jgi:transcriptional regulator of heat shock response
MNTRQSQLLAALIDHFIQTAEPVGSQRLLEVTHFSVSPATIRAEMGALEDLGFLEQPHISAGRIPTAMGFRRYVKEFLEPSREEQVVRRKFEKLKTLAIVRKDQERVYEAVALLSHMIPHVSFASIPHRERVFYMGFANVLRQPEFLENPLLASNVAEVLETRLADFLEQVELDDRVHYYIGEEHMLEQIQSCSILATTYHLPPRPGSRLSAIVGVLGILGPMRMDYAYNTVALELVEDFLRSG